MRDELDVVREARPGAAGPDPAVARRAREELLAAIAASGRPRRRWTARPRLVLAAAALAAVALAAAVGVTLPGRGGDGEAWAAELVRVAEAAPRLLVAAPGWRVERADEFSVDFGEMTFAGDGRTLEVRWQPAGELAGLVASRSHESDLDATATAAGAEARVFRYAGTSEYVAVWARKGYAIEVRGSAASPEEFAALLGSLEEVDVDAWLSAMPASVVVGADRAAVVDELLAGIPLPPGFDTAPLRTGEAVRSRYQLGAAVAGSVACGWIARWAKARAAGDEATAREAAEAMATARTWPVLVEMDAAGDYPEAVWEYAAAMATDADVPAGKPGVTVEGSYEAALGCPEP